jgi:hypothetical protein
MGGTELRRSPLEDDMYLVVPECGSKQATWPAGAGLFLLAQALRHFEMVLQVRQGLARPILQLRIVAALGVTLEQRDRR